MVAQGVEVGIDVAWIAARRAVVDPSSLHARSQHGSTTTSYTEPRAVRFVRCGVTAGVRRFVEVSQDGVSWTPLEVHYEWDRLLAR